MDHRNYPAIAYHQQVPFAVPGKAGVQAGKPPLENL